MTKKFLLMSFTILLVATAFLLKVPSEARPWIIYVAGLFIGLLIFDSKIETSATESSHYLYLLLMSVLFFTVTTTNADDFWRVSSGAVFIMSLVNEGRSKEWALGSQLRAYTIAIFPAYLIFVGTTLEIFTPEGRAILSLLGLVVFTLPLIMTSIREGREEVGTAGAIALASSGTLVLFGAQFVNKDIKSVDSIISDIAIISLPILAAIISVVSLFIAEKNKRRNLFYGACVLLLIWSSLSQDKFRFSAAFCMLVFLVWHSGLPICSTDKTKEYLGIFSEYSRWAMPGSAAFTALLLILLPTDVINLQIGIMLWILVFVLFWINTGTQESEHSNKDESHWDWKSCVALSTTFIGGACVLGVNHFPVLLERCERIIQLCISSF